MLMQANNCMFKHPFDAKDRSRVRLQDMNWTESSDSVKKKNRPILSQKLPITSNDETLHDISLIFFSVDNKDTGLDVKACIHFESSAVLSCSGGSGSNVKVLGSHPDLKTRQSEEDDMLCLEQQPFGKREETNSQISVRVNTTKRVSIKHDKWFKHFLCVAILPSDGKKRDKVFVVAVAWSSLCFDWYVRQRLRSPAPFQCGPLQKWGLKSISKGAKQYCTAVPTGQTKRCLKTNE